MAAQCQIFRQSRIMQGRNMKEILSDFVFFSQGNYTQWDNNSLATNSTIETQLFDTM